MSDAEERFRARAAQLGEDLEVTTHAEPTRTAADAAATIGCEVAQIVKSLVLMADDDPVMVLASGARRVDPQRIAAAVGAGRARMATPDEVRAATGYTIGGTPPFGHDERLRTVVDPALLDHGTVWAAAGTPRSTFPIAPRDLVRLSGGTVQDVAAS